MPRYQVRKDIRFEYEVNAETEAEALAVPWPKEDNDAVTVLRQRARDLDRPTSAGRAAITGRELRPGRRLIARYRKAEWRAEVRTDGQIEVQRKGSSQTLTFPTLAKAAVHIVDGKAVNAWALFRDAEPAAEKPKKGEGKSHEGETDPQP